MSEKDNFGMGFLFGTIVGGFVGGVIATVVANQGKENKNDAEQESTSYSALNPNHEAENTRLSLEEKINQLNHAIDDVRVTLLKSSETQESELD